MPELPEVESIRRTLEPRLLGARVFAAALLRPDILSAPRSEPHASRRRRLLVDGRITLLRRHGKQLAILTHDERACIVRLGMSGSLRWSPDTPPRNPSLHVHCVWTLDSGRGHIWFADPRRFGGLTSLRGNSLPAHWAALGPDALTVTGSHLDRTLTRSARAVKAALLDQRVLAGVGNIYADEALFLAKVPPHALCDTLSPADWESLATLFARSLYRPWTQAGRPSETTAMERATPAATRPTTASTAGRASRARPAARLSPAASSPSG